MHWPLSDMNIQRTLLVILAYRRVDALITLKVKDMCSVHVEFSDNF